MGGTLVSTKFGDQLEGIVHTSVDVTSAGALVLGANPNRRYLLIQNDSNSVIYLHCISQGGLNEGVRIGGGEKWEMCDIVLGCSVYAIVNSIPPKRLLVTEGW